ncbi:transposase [bacterium]|nr:transposase [bacterium]
MCDQASDDGCGNDTWERRSPDRHSSFQEETEKSQSGDWRSQEEKSQSGDWRSQEEKSQSGDWRSRGYLPHYDPRSVVQHVTVHLADSLAPEAIEQIEQSLAALPDDHRQAERRRRLHEWIDAGHGRCVLRHPKIAAMVRDTFLHFIGVRYHLHAWVVMPNHIHVLVEPLEDWTLAKIVASWKKFTARKIKDFERQRGKMDKNSVEDKDNDKDGANREIGVPRNADLLIGRNAIAPIWHREYWDRYIRNQEHYDKALAYIHNNPVTARLASCPEDWPWSSAAQAIPPTNPT